MSSDEFNLKLKKIMEIVEELDKSKPDRNWILIQNVELRERILKGEIKVYTQEEFSRLGGDTLSGIKLYTENIINREV